MHYKRNKVGKFARYDYKIIKRNRKAKLVTGSILLSAGILALAVVGGQEVYNQASQRVKDMFNPKVIEVTADTLEPTDMKDWVLWKVKQAGIDPYEAYAIIQRESKWDNQATGVNIHKDGSTSVDMGLWQLNTTKWHSKKTDHYISPACAYDYKCATEEAIKIHKSWKGWGAWTTAKDLGLK